MADEIKNRLSLLDPLLAEKLERRGDCVEYTGYRNKDGYGRLNRDGVVLAAHRRTWELLVGKIEEGLYLCHECDNPACCNPAHLFPGTQADNMRDMVKKGRGRWPGAKGRINNHGSKNPNAKLTPFQVAWIRENHVPRSRGEFGSGAMARKFGVDSNTIRYIAKGNGWKKGLGHG